MEALEVPGEFYYTSGPTLLDRIRVLIDYNDNIDHIMLQVERIIGIGVITVMVTLMGMIGSMAKDMPPQTAIMNYCTQSLFGLLFVLSFLITSVMIRLLHSVLRGISNALVFIVWCILTLYNCLIFSKVVFKLVLNIANAVEAGPLIYPYAFPSLGF